MIEDLPKRAVGFVRSYERPLVGLCFAGLAAFLFVLGVGPVRRQALGQIEKLFEIRNAHWAERVQQGELLLTQKKYDAAQAHFTQLDRTLPANHVKHTLSNERRRVLAGLGASEVGRGRKRRALTAHRRLVEFDPRDYQSHFLAAQASLHFKETGDAAKHLAEVLRIHPNHGPSAHALSTLHAEGGDFEAATKVYEDFLHAYQVQTVKIQIGATSVDVRVPVDGRFHDVRGRIDPPSHGEPVIEAVPFDVDIERIDLVPALVVGAHDQKPPNAEVRLRIRLFKAVETEHWTMVRQAYRNTLDWSGLKAAQALTSTAGASR